MVGISRIGTIKYGIGGYVQLRRVGAGTLHT